MIENQKLRNLPGPGQYELKGTLKKHLGTKFSKDKR